MIVSLEHSLVQIRIEAFARLRIDPANAMLRQGTEQHAFRRCHACQQILHQRVWRRELLGDTFQGAAEIIGRR